MAHSVSGSRFTIQKQTMAADRGWTRLKVTHRDGIAIHIGPGCSEGCALLPGGKAGLADFKDAVTKMLAEDNENGFGTGINVIFSPRNESFTLEDGLLKPQTTDEIKSREKDETQKKP